MKTKNKFVISPEYYSFSVVSVAAILLYLGLLTTSAQTGTYLFIDSTTNITLNPGTYNITAYGGQGGSGFYGQGPGGLGAEVEGQFNFTTAITLQLLVAGSGNGGGYGGGGGGGGSFAVLGITPLVVAGGGGGSGDSLLGGAGLVGEGGVNPYGPYEGGVGTGVYGSGAGGGAYGAGGGGGYGGGGGGYYGSGASGNSGGGGGARILSKELGTLYELGFGG